MSIVDQRVFLISDDGAARASDSILPKTLTIHHIPLNCWWCWNHKMGGVPWSYALWRREKASSTGLIAVVIWTRDVASDVRVLGRWPEVGALEDCLLPVQDVQAIWMHATFIEVLEAMTGWCGWLILIKQIWIQSSCFSNRWCVIEIWLVQVVLVVSIGAAGGHGGFYSGLFVSNCWCQLGVIEWVLGNVGCVGDLLVAHSQGMPVVLIRAARWSSYVYAD